MKIFNFSIFLILVIFPFGQLTRIPLGIPEINIYFHDLVIGTLVLTWFFYHLLAKKPFPKTPLTKPILAFFLVATFSLVSNLTWLKPQEVVVASLYLWRWIFYAGIYFIISDLKIDLKWGLVLAGVVVAFLGLVQYFLYPDLTNLVYLGWDPHRYRVFGTFFDPGFLGMILVLTLILIIDFFLGAGGDEFFHPTLSLTALKSSHSTKSLVQKDTAVSVGMSKIVTHRLLISFILYLLSYISLALTYSRASYLAYLVGIGVIAWIKKAPKFFLIILLLGILTIFLLPRPPESEAVRLEREESALGRVRNWRQSLIIAKDRPFFGVGFNAYRYTQKEYGFLKENWQESHAGAGADSSLLFVLATTGILGFLAYAWLLYDILIYHIRDPVVLPSIIALLIHSFFNNSLFYPWIMLWVWILVAVKEKK